MQMIRWKLKERLVSRYGSQINAAQTLNLRESRLSYLVNGHAEPSPEELHSFRKALGSRVVREIFGV